MTAESGGRDPVERLAEEFAERYRRGERPSLSEYAQKYPALADQIRELFPALLALEERQPAGQSTASHPPSPPGPLRPALGEYRLLRELGRGGMGVVYEAVQEPLGRHVALKILPAQRSASAVYRERFRREAQAAARLHHTNIVPVFGVGEHEGTSYYAMQFIPGQGLDAVLKEVRRLNREGEPGPAPAEASVTEAAWMLLSGGLAGASSSAPTRPAPYAPLAPGPAPTVPQAAGPGAAEAPASGTGRSGLLGQTQGQYFRSAARIGLQVAEALAYAHHHGVVHRDIKPSNLLLDRGGTVWVTDFGLAKTEGSEDLTRPGDVVGTVRYVPPERLSGVSDARGDVYGLGVTLYEMLTLRPAFADADKARLLQRLASEEPPRPTRLNPAVPRDLETVVLKAMAKDPGHRYATARALADDLRRFLEDRPIRARRISYAEHAWRWCRRNPALAAVGALALLALLAAAVLSTALAVQESRTAHLLQAEQDRTLTALRESRRLSAGLTLDKSLAICEQGDAGLGLLWLARSLDLAAEAEDDDLEQAVRLNLAAWQHHLGALHEMLPHGAPVAAVAVSPDGRLIASADWDGYVRLWDAHSGEPVAGPWKHRSRARVVAFRPDGKVLASGGGDDAGGDVWLREVPGGRPLFAAPLRHAAEVRLLAFSPDGQKLIAADTTGAASVWATATGKPLLKEPLHHADNQKIHAIAFSPDGTLIATGSRDLTACLWDARTGERVRQLPAHKGEAWATAFSPDGTVLVTGTLRGEVKAWEVATGKRLPAGDQQHRSAVRALAFRPDGERLLVALGDGTIPLFDPKNWGPVGLPLKQRTATLAAVLTPDGRRVVAGGRDGVVRVWQLPADEPVVRTLAASDSPRAAAFSADGELLVTEQDNTAWLWQVATGERRLREPLIHEGPVAAVTISPDGRWVLTGSDDKTARLWETATGKPRGPPLRHKSAVHAVAFRPDGAVIATSDADGAVHLWETAGGKQVLSDFLPYQGMLTVLAFSPDGQILLAGNREDSVRLWRIDGREQVGPTLNLPGGCYAAAFSGDGRQILTGSGEGVAQLWESGTGRRLGPELALNETVVAVAFSRGGDLLLTGGRDGRVRLWHARTGRAIGPALRSPSRPDAVAFRPDGRLLLAGGGGVLLTQKCPWPLPGGRGQIPLWVQCLTGTELLEDGSFRGLQPSEWRARRRRLREDGAVPSPDD